MLPGKRSPKRTAKGTNNTSFVVRSLVLNKEEGTMAIEIVSFEFVSSHGHLPRGFGSWGFEVFPTRLGRANGLEPQIVWIHHSNFGAARRQVLILARAFCASRVAVMP